MSKSKMIDLRPGELLAAAATADNTVLLGCKTKHNFAEWTLKFADVRLVSVEGASYALNRAVLAVASALFRKLLLDADDAGSDTLVIHTQVTTSQLAAFCHFACRGVIPSTSQLDEATTEAFANLGVDLKALKLECVSQNDDETPILPIKSDVSVDDPSRIVVETKVELFKENDAEDLPLRKSKRRRRKSAKQQHFNDYHEEEETPPELPEIDGDFDGWENLKVEDDQEDEYVPEAAEEGDEKEDEKETNAKKKTNAKAKGKKRKYILTVTKKRPKDMFHFPQEGERDLSCKFQCTRCVRGFHARDSLKQHLFRHDAKGPHEAWACLLCDGKVKFEFYKDMLEHKQREHGDMSLECSHCGRKFLYKKYLLNHMKIHSDPVKWHYCVCCGKKFEKQSQVNNHMKARGKYHNDRCPLCPDVQFKSWQEHREHVAQVHGGNFVFRCRYCPKVFETDTLKRRHMSTAHSVNSGDNDQQKVVCEHCGKSVFKKHYSKHVQGVHGTKKLQCSQCTSVFKEEAALKRHVKELHTKMTCEVCGKVFPYRSYQRHYLRQHTPEHLKPFKCDICVPLRGFICRQDLSEHMNTHTMDRPHVCQICSAAFRSSGNLCAHIRGTDKGIKRIKKP